MNDIRFDSRQIFSWASAGALFCALAQAPAHAQSAEVAASETPATEIQEIVVSGSRVQRVGFTSPTPTTEIDSDTLEKLGTTNIGAALAQLPAFQSDQSGTTGTLGGSAGRRFANLRNLGSQRTLVMMDGQRLMPSAITGQVDLNGVPQILLDRVDVVTGGASAQWGSDAVSGVVNMVTKKKVNGFQFDGSYGVSDLDDNIEKHLGGVWGTDFADGKGQIVVGSEWVDNNGVGLMYTRDWGREEWGFVPNPARTATNGLPTTLVMPNVRRNVLVAGGLITSGPLAGTTFDANGQARPFQYGSVSGAGTMSGGEGYGTGDGAGKLLSPPVERSVSQLRVSYDLTPETEIYGVFNYGYIHAHTRGPSHGDNTAVTIRSGNPYIPQELQDRMTQMGITSFGLTKFWRDDPRGNGLGSSVDVNTFTRNQYYTGGAKGVLGGSWTWDGYLQYARSEVEFRGDGYRVSSRFTQALDAVRDGSGKIVCRSTLTNPNDGCVPVNLLGPNAITLDAWNYMTGTQQYVTTFDRLTAAANVNGTPFATWAGDVSVAAGLEHRKDEAELVQTDPIALARGYTLGNTQPIAGEVKVSEGYVESVVPLAADLPFAKLLELDGAVRLTDYSTSGDVTTWKLGLNYSIDDNLRLRASVSRDIRAPNISELYTSVSTGTTNIRNPETGGNLTARTQTSGNTDLTPERARTSTAGFVFTPSFLKGLKLSADYYDIDIRDVIASVSAQQVFDYCYQGSASFCDLITPISQQEATVRLVQVNLAQLNVKGVDAHVAYDFTLPNIPGRWDVNYFLTYQPTVLVDTGITRVNRAGDMGTAATPYGGPKTKWNALLSYSIDRLTTTVGVRYVGAGVKNVTNTALDIDDNSVKSATYVLLSGGYDLPSFHDGLDLQIYGNVQNLLDRDPPVDPTSAEGGGYNPTFHDVIGRTYMIGLRAKF